MILDLFYDVYKNGELLERYHEYGEVAVISRDETIRLLEENGFEVVSIYGDFDKSKHRRDSPKLALVTRRKRHIIELIFEQMNSRGDW